MKTFTKGLLITFGIFAILGVSFGLSLLVEFSYCKIFDDYMLFFSLIDEECTFSYTIDDQIEPEIISYYFFMSLLVGIATLSLILLSLTIIVTSIYLLVYGIQMLYLYIFNRDAYHMYDIWSFSYIYGQYLFSNICESSSSEDETSLINAYNIIVEDNESISITIANAVK